MRRRLLKRSRATAKARPRKPKNPFRPPLTLLSPPRLPKGPHQAPRRPRRWRRLGGPPRGGPARELGQGRRDPAPEHGAWPLAMQANSWGLLAAGRGGAGRGGGRLRAHRTLQSINRWKSPVAGGSMRACRAVPCMALGEARSCFSRSLRLRRHACSMKRSRYAPCRLLLLQRGYPLASCLSPTTRLFQGGDLGEPASPPRCPLLTRAGGPRRPRLCRPAAELRGRAGGRLLEA